MARYFTVTFEIWSWNYLALYLMVLIFLWFIFDYIFMILMHMLYTLYCGVFLVFYGVSHNQFASEGGYLFWLTRDLARLFRKSCCFFVMNAIPYSYLFGCTRSSQSYMVKKTLKNLDKKVLADHHSKEVSVGLPLIRGFCTLDICESLNG